MPLPLVISGWIGLAIILLRERTQWLDVIRHRQPPSFPVKHVLPSTPTSARLQLLKVYWCSVLAEDGHQGSKLDNAVLDAIRNIEEKHPDD